MKKLVGLICSILLLISCGTQSPQEDKSLTITSSVEIQTFPADMQNYRFLEDQEHVFEETTMREVAHFMAEGGSGILFFGYVGCPWCERAVPIINQAAKDAGLKIYYVDVRNPINTLDDYYVLQPYIEPIFVEDSSGQKVFKVPEVVGVKNGEIVGNHLALLDDFKIENENSQMSAEQKERLYQEYRKILEAASD